MVLMFRIVKTTANVDELWRAVEELRIAVAELRSAIEELKKQASSSSKTNEVRQSSSRFISTIYGFQNSEDFEKMVKVLEDIALRDETLIWSGNADAREIVLYSTDKDALHKKSMWFVKKVGIANLSYRVEEG
jgi:phage shock protein A